VTEMGLLGWLLLLGAVFLAYRFFFAGGQSAG
jgi:hypothetical protein